MLYLLEGLNCSGKSTWISKQIRNQIDSRDGLRNPFKIKTSWANPLCWESHKRSIITDGISEYALGCYETIIEAFIGTASTQDVYWDRTFISAFAYHSIRREVYDFLVEVLYKYKQYVKIVFVDTAVDTTLERWEKLKGSDPTYRSYAWANNRADAMRVQEEFYRLIGGLQKHDFDITIV